MATEVQEPYNLFAQQKQQYYPGTQNQQPQQPIVPGNVQGATVQDFANGKAAANSQAGVANQPVTTPVTPVNTTATDSGKTMGIRSGEWDNEPMKRGGYTQPITSMDDLAKAMGYTSPQEEEKLRKASVANRRILAVADAMRHIGNIYNTVRYAPAQQFNSPVLEEQSRYERGKAMRDKANQIYLSYQQQKAAQDAKQKQWEAEQKQKADQWNATYKFNAAKAAAEMAEKQRQYNSTLGFNKEKQKATEARWKAQDEETRRHHNATVGLGYARLKETKRHNSVVESRGGGRGGTNPYLYAAPNGGTLSLPRSLNSVQIDQIVTNPAFKKYRNRTALQEAMLQAGVQTNDPAQVRRYEAAMMIAQHPDVAEWAAGRFGGSINGMQPSPVVQQQYGMNGYIAPGNTWSQPGSNFDWSQYQSGVSAQDGELPDDEDEEIYDWDEFEVH